MTQFTVEDFHPKHTVNMWPGHYDRIMIASMRDVLDKAAGKGLTAIVDGQPIGSIFIGVSDNVGEVIIIASDDLRRKHGMQMALMFKRRLETIRDMGITILVARVEPKWPKAIDFAKLFGFRQIDDITWVRAV